MEQKTKLSVLIILLIVVISGSVYWVLSKNNTPSVTPATQMIPQSNKKIPDAAKVNSESVREISGKVRSIEEKAVYIELADGQDFAAKINPDTPVFTPGSDTSSLLPDLKVGQDVVIKADDANNAVQIWIK